MGLSPDLSFSTEGTSNIYWCCPKKSTENDLSQLSVPVEGDRLTKEEEKAEVVAKGDDGPGFPCMNWFMCLLEL